VVDATRDVGHEKIGHSSRLWGCQEFQEFLALIRKIMRRVNGVLRVSSLNEENNEESYRSFSFRSMRLLSSRGVDLRREFLALIRSI
jgi:hypothetical protein